MYQTLVEMLLHMLALVSGRNGCPSLNAGTTRQSALRSATPPSKSCMDFHQGTWVWISPQLRQCLSFISGCLIRISCSDWFISTCNGHCWKLKFSSR